MIKQQKLLLNIKQDGLVVLEELERSKIPLVSKVVSDNYIGQATKNFDYKFNGENKFYPFLLPECLNDLDFNILCIVGSSGSGKSVMAQQYFGQEKEINWDNNKAIISNFSSICDEKEAVERLSAVGLNSIPTWCKPRNVLSVGEGFRADLAMKISNNCVIDEFTSTIDRNVAKSCSMSIGKYVRKKGLKKCVFVSCHKDFIDYLKPDYIIDLDEGYLYDARGLPQPSTKLSIYNITSKDKIWRLFAKHHYLSANINKSSRCYVAYIDNDIVGFISILPFPSGTVDNAWRCHHLVVLPDYQGLGVGKALLNYFANLIVKEDCIFYIRTSHPKMYNMLYKDERWEETGRSGTISPSAFIGSHWKAKDNIAYSFKYIGKYKQCGDKNVHIVKHKYKKKYKQLNMFDIA